MLNGRQGCEELVNSTRLDYMEVRRACVIGARIFGVG